MLPHENVLSQYPIPFTLRKDQIDAINDVCFRDWSRAALFMDVGTGKTVVSTLIALQFGLESSIDQVIVLMPPILLDQWAEWLRNFPELDVIVYSGSPAKRASKNLGADFVLMTYGIFKNDYVRLTEFYKNRKVLLLVDEAAAIRNIKTLIYKATRDFVDNLPDKRLLMLTGTAINTPTHAYAYIKLKTPEIYRDYAQFLLCHVTSVDIYDEPDQFKNLDVLADNLKFNSVRIKADDVLDLPEVTTVPIYYELETKHLKLYRKLVDEKLAMLDNNQLLDGTTPQRLRHTCQRLILMPSEFGGDSLEPKAFSLIDAMAGELGMLSGGHDKLVIFCNYNSSNQAIFDYVLQIPGLNPIQAYGVTGPEKNLKAVGQFLKEPSTNVLIAHPRSIGIGLNLQSVCRAVLFLELPLTSNDYIQALGRVKREGQKRNIIVWLAVARKTIQVDIASRITKKEDTAQKVYETKDTLKKALYGE